MGEVRSSIVHISHEAVYWTALAHLPNWSRKKINQLFDVLLINRFTFSDFFLLNPEDWKSLFHLSEADIQVLITAQKKITHYSALVEKLYGLGYEIIPVHSRSYPSQLREKLGKSHTPTIIYIRGNTALLNQPAVSLFGSNRGSGNGLIFSQNMIQHFVQNQLVLVTSYDLGYNRYILNLCVYGKILIQQMAR
ncbi:MAG: DNA-processing protein DprA [Candidatus Atribacteria bacterium]|nr:DNA-processing protein DprA [Candidatus Atribacteria bacterium]